MKIINRKAFLSLPSGVLYTKFEPCIFGDIAIKGESMTNDWAYQDLLQVKLNDQQEYGDLLSDVYEKGDNFDLDLECMGRDGNFEDKQLFAVFEKEDVEELIERLNKTIADYPFI